MGEKFKEFREAVATMFRDRYGLGDDSRKYWESANQLRTGEYHDCALIRKSFDLGETADEFVSWFAAFKGLRNLQDSQANLRHFMLVASAPGAGKPTFSTTQGVWEAELKSGAAGKRAQ